MTFTSPEFVIFFCAVLLMRMCFRKPSGEKWLLIVASICFYLTWSFIGVFFLLITAVVDFGIAKRLAGTTDPRSRGRLLLASLTWNIGILAFFKYTNFFLENSTFALNALGLHVAHVRYDIILLPAISYFTFSSLSYVIDVYNKRIPPCEHIRDYAFFLTFFPKLLSGPIARATTFIPQLTASRRVDAVGVETAMAYLLLGAVKKLVIADQVSGNVNLIFSSPNQFDGFTLFQGVLGYATQIYCDFSGYSDMAIGFALLLGFKLPENFQMPFSAVTITDYWRRWHITMSTWFRDYVFFPLEMARKRSPSPTIRTASSIIATMLLCGLWHGAGWTFVIWGAVHGLALATHVVWIAFNPLVSLKNNGWFRLCWTFVSRVLTLSVVLLSLICFRAQSLAEASRYLSRLLSWTHDGTRLVSPYIVPAVVVVFLVHLLVGKDRVWAREIPFRSFPLRVLAYSSLVLLLICFAATDAAPFIYFQF